MPGVFIGVLRSGTVEDVRAKLEGIDVSLSPVLALPGVDGDGAPPAAPPPVATGDTSDLTDGNYPFGDVVLLVRGGVPVEAVQNSNPSRRADVPLVLWQLIQGTFPDQIWLPMLAIAFLESDFRPTVKNPSPLEESYGVFQINRNAWPQYSIESLTTFVGNVAAAWDVYKAQGYPAWLNSATLAGLI